MFCRQLEAFEHVWKPLHNHEKHTKAVRIPVHGFIRCRPWLWWRMWSKMEWSQRTIAHLFGKSFACQSQGIIPTYCYTKWYVRSPNHWDVRSQWVCMFQDGSFYWIFQCVVPFAQQHPSSLSIMFGHKLLSSLKSQRWCFRTQNRKKLQGVGPGRLVDWFIKQYSSRDISTIL